MCLWERRLWLAFMAEKAFLLHTHRVTEPYVPFPLQGLPPQILTEVKKPDAETGILELGGSFTYFIVY